MESERIVCFVDGFNMYHALKQLQQPHVKWLDLQLLFSRLIRCAAASVAGGRGAVTRRRRDRRASQVAACSSRGPRAPRTVAR